MALSLRFVDFFTMVPSPLAEVIYNAETGALLSALPKSIYYLIFLNNDCQCIMASFSNLFYLFLMLFLQLISTAQIKSELRHVYRKKKA